MGIRTQKEHRRGKQTCSATHQYIIYKTTFKTICNTFSKPFKKTFTTPFRKKETNILSIQITEIENFQQQTSRTSDRIRRDWCPGTSHKFQPRRPHLSYINNHNIEKPQSQTAPISQFRKFIPNSQNLPFVAQHTAHFGIPNHSIQKDSF